MLQKKKINKILKKERKKGKKDLNKKKAEKKQTNQHKLEEEMRKSRQIFVVLFSLCNMITHAQH